MRVSLFDQLPRGIECRHAIRIKATADAVWRIVGDIGEASVGKGLVERIEVQGQGVGAVRTLHAAGGVAIRERIEEYSATDRYYVYRVIDSGPLDFTHYLAAASVTPAGSDECVLLWITTATAVDGREAEMRALLDSNIHLVLSRVKAMVEPPRRA